MIFLIRIHIFSVACVADYLSYCYPSAFISCYMKRMLCGGQLHALKFKIFFLSQLVLLHI